MRMTEVNMEQHRNERAGERGDPRENPLTNGIVRCENPVDLGVYQLLNFTALSVLEPVSFLDWLLQRCEATPFLTELHLPQQNITYGESARNCPRRLHCQDQGTERVRTQRRNSKPDTLIREYKFSDRLRKALVTGLVSGWPLRDAEGFLLAGLPASSSKISLRLQKYIHHFPCVRSLAGIFDVAAFLMTTTTYLPVFVSLYQIRNCFKSIVTNFTGPMSLSAPIKIPVGRWLDDLPPTKASRVRFPVRSLPGFLHVGIVTDDGAGQRVFSGISRSLRF
ncbi:hypothetical protein PR048_027565 [Dryococelus australis]|uniref:Uncharacterized protein n=1 Tax=Dryococelus australis TaxID=614101 RepID=A0ABQ9GGV8_9NEOP|nr:hypothetical protein PR048_027565 [Dryococelus australis]